MTTRTVGAFSKILIANRGEIACRVIRTARAMGYGTVAVYSEADENAVHARLADEAALIGPPPVGQSYLDIGALLDAARKSGADAVHPGYGFLSENEDFARACEAAGLIFIGPSHQAIRAMGNKAAAKRLMIEAGVPCVPGYQGADQSDATLIAQAGRIGFPLMVKAAAGGGGRGMRLVADAGDLPGALASARSEAQNAFGSGELILERAVIDARHVEIQVFGDAFGNVVHLGERDCSAQRRHQKVIEEAPSPAVSPALRAKMGAAAVAAAREIDYRGAGTVEFLLGGDGEFYFLEMNTRLQVEHPVTEAITGLDLVEWQLRVAAGEKLPLSQEEIRFWGHAIEVRLYAEDPARDFLPQSGDILRWRAPQGEGLRVDCGIETGSVVSPWYDPMIAKVIAFGDSRESARRRLVQGLRGARLFGLAHNRDFLVAALENPVFAAGGATTAFIPAQFPNGLARREPDGVVLALAAALLRSRAARPGLLANWDSTGVFPAPVKLVWGDRAFEFGLAASGDGAFLAKLAGETVGVRLAAVEDGGVEFIVEGHRRKAGWLIVGDEIHIDFDGAQYVLRETTRAGAGAGDKGGDLRLLAPMNGRIVAVLAAPGEAVKKGQRIVILEAMKMQHEITANRDGVVESVGVREGDQVATRHVLATLAEAAQEKADA